MEFSFIHTADIHLGRAFADIGHELTNEQKEILKKAHETAFQKMCNFAVEHKVDFVLIAGDTFDDCEHDLHSKLVLISELKKLESNGIDVHIVCGNHDPASSYTNELSFKDSAKIHIFGVNTETKPTAIYKNEQHIAQLYPFGFSTNEYKDSPCKNLCKSVSKDVFNIGLIHCDIQGDKNTYAPCSEKELLELDYDYYALGHIHKPYENGKIIYSGTIQARSKKDSGEHGFKYITVKNNQIASNTFITCDSVRYYDFEYCVSEENSATETVENLSSRLTELQNETELSIISLTLNGICHYKKTSLEELRRELSNTKLVISEINDCTVTDTPQEQIITTGGVLARILNNVNDKEFLKNVFQKTKNEIPDLLKHVEEIRAEEIIPSAISIAQTTCCEIYGRGDSDE